MDICNLSKICWVSCFLIIVGMIIALLSGATYSGYLWFIPGGMFVLATFFTKLGHC